MKTRIVILSMALTCLDFSQAQAIIIIDSKIFHQARLTDPAGAPLAGNFDITYRIFDADVGGTMLWEETHSDLEVSNGIFYLTLGEFVPIPTNVIVNPRDEDLVTR